MTDAYTAAFANNALGPFMLLTVTGQHRERIAQATQILVSFDEPDAALQLASYAPPGSIVGLQEIAPPSNPTPAKKTKIEVVAGLAIGGIVLTVMLGVIADTVIRRRDRRRDAPPDQARRPREAVARETPTRFEVPMR